MRYEKEKVERAQSMMRKEGVDFLVCRNSENVLYFSGYWPIRGWLFSIMPSEGDPILLTPDYEVEFTEKAWARDVRVYTGKP